MLAFLGIFLAQAFYTVADVLQKLVLGGHGFSAKTLLSPRFLATFFVSGTGFVFQMYALSKLDLSKTITLLSTLGVVLAVAAGIIYFHDKLNAWNYLGVGFAVVAIVLVHMK